MFMYVYEKRTSAWEKNISSLGIYLYKLYILKVDFTEMSLYTLNFMIYYLIYKYSLYNTVLKVW